MPPASPAAHPLVRGLSLVAAVAVIIATVIGTGVFVKARVMTCNVGDPQTVLWVWVVAGLLSMAGALTYAELGTMMPRAGGEYNYLKAAYGPRWGFLSGWVQLFVNKGGTQAAVAVVSAGFLNDLLGGAIGRPLFALGAFEVTTLNVVAIGIIWLATVLNLAAVRASGGVATALTAVKVALVVGLGAGAYLLADGAVGHYAMSGAAGTCEGVAASARGGVAGFGAAMLGALWGYDGWNNLTLVAGEVRDPDRTIPRAFVIGMVALIGLYVLANASYFYVLTPEAVASVGADERVAVVAAQEWLSPGLVALVVAALVVSTFGTVHGSILTGARVPYALAADGLLPKKLGETSASGVPVPSVLLQGAWATVLALSGTFDTLTDYVVFGSWIFYGLTISAVFRLRRRMPDAHRPYRAWGYPVVPVLFLLVTGFLLVNTLVATPVLAVLGLGLIALGLPVYAYFNRRAAAAGGPPAR